MNSRRGREDRQQREVLRRDSIAAALKRAGEPLLDGGARIALLSDHLACAIGGRLRAGGASMFCARLRPPAFANGGNGPLSGGSSLPVSGVPLGRDSPWPRDRPRAFWRLLVDRGRRGAAQVHTRRVCTC